MYFDRRISIPIQYANKDTIAQWIEDPRTGRDMYRLRIYIEEFHRNEVNVRVEGRKLFVYGERIENKSQVRRRIIYIMFKFVFLHSGNIEENH